MSQASIRNIAVIAHVDHGKTTLVDALLKQTHTFRDNQDEMQQERILDSNDLERERGITILAKICAVAYQGTRINIIDTPGHVDFSGEVERTLSMADGALLIVDAQEGPMPQTRFVLKKALALNLKLIVVINKIDKQYARVREIEHKLSDLFLELATHDDHLEFTSLYAVGRAGAVFESLPESASQPGTVEPLLKAIISEIPAPQTDATKPFKMLVSALDYDNHVGRIVIGKIFQGSIVPGQKVVIVSPEQTNATVEEVMVAQGLERVKVASASAGDIVALTGLGKATIGSTIADTSDREPLPTLEVTPPTLAMTLGPNTSPFAGKEGQFTTSRQLGERLTRELENNVSLRVEPLDNGQFRVAGRGELHLSILLEIMRREGYEMEVGKPEVVTKIIDGVEQEPVEELNIVVDSEYVGAISQELGKRQAQLLSMEPMNEKEVMFNYSLPTRSMLGLRSYLMTQTKGTLLFSSQFSGFEPLGQPLPKMRKGALIAAVTGKAVEYGLRTLKGRGLSFVQPGTQVYEGMIVGQNSRDDDIAVNVCKEKNLTNHRSKSHQGITQLAPDVDMSLEQAIDFLERDELLEITPQSLRLRKKYLTELQRRRA